MLFRFQFQYLHAGLISQLKFSCFSPTTIPHNICIHEIQCQSFHNKSNSNQQKNPHWGYTGLSQAIEESAEDDQNRFRQRDHHSNVYGFGVPKPKPKTPQEVERRLRSVLYQHDKRKDYLHTMDSDLHWDLGIAMGKELDELVMSLEYEFEDVYFHEGVYIDCRKFRDLHNYICCQLNISTKKKTVREVKAERQKRLLLEANIGDKMPRLEAGKNVEKFTTENEKEDKGEDNEFDWMELTRRKE